MLSYILVLSRVYILLISISHLSDLNIWKIIYLATYILAILFKNYFKGAKIVWLFAQLYKNSTDYFVLKVLTVDIESRFQNRICIIESQKKENKILQLITQEMGGVTTVEFSISQNLKRDKAIIQITQKLVQDNESSSF